MENIRRQQSKVKEFRNLHHGNSILVLPNIWDPLGAALLESLGYKAVATASAAVAWTNGFHDGEHTPLEDILKRLEQIAKSVDVPVTADFESGYAENELQLEKNIELLLQTGIVGINLEDFDKQSGLLFPPEIQCKRIRAVKKAANAMQVSLFINARTDAYFRGKHTDQKKKINETLERGKAYMDAGADCFFPLAVKDKDELAYLLTYLKCPINVIALPGIPDLNTLQEMGVTRLSLGPGFLKIAIKAMKELAQKLINNDGLEEVASNDITSEFVKNLIK